MYHVTGLAELKSELAKVRHASASPFSRPPLTWKNCLAANDSSLRCFLLGSLFLSAWNTRSFAVLPALADRVKFPSRDRRATQSNSGMRSFASRALRGHRRHAFSQMA